MAADDSSGARPPVVLRIKLRYEDLDTMVARFAPNVGKSGLFLPTKSIQPIGTEVKFELRLANDTAVLVGLGRVRASRALDPANPKIAFGMAIELLRVNREGRDLILKMLERRRQTGLPEVSLPMPEDVDAARRQEVDSTSVRDTVATAVPQPMVPLESAGENLMTAPRRSSGPIGVAKEISVKALAPEPPRRKRPAVAELIASAQSGPVAVAAMPELDADIDVAAAVLRARTLAAGADLDGELEALRDAGAAPIEISVEAASAELARQLGGVAIDRRRHYDSTRPRWAPPPPIVVDYASARAALAAASQADVDTALPAFAPPLTVPMVSPRAVTLPIAVIELRPPGPVPPAEAVPVAHEPHAEAVAHELSLPDADAEEAVAVSDAEIVDEASASQVTEAPPPSLLEVGDDEQVLFAAPIARPITRPPPMIDDDSDPSEFEHSDATVGPPVGGYTPAVLQRIAAELEQDKLAAALEEDIEDEIEQLSDMDLEDASEHTYAGSLPVDPHSPGSSGPDFEAFATPYPGGYEQAAVHELADRLDAHLAEAEAEGDDLGFDREGMAAEPQQVEPLEARSVDPDADAELLDPEYIEEVEDFEILAEADADDADLLTAHGEADMTSGSHPIVRSHSEPAPELDHEPSHEPEGMQTMPADPEPRPSYLDFASRLELSDEHPAAVDPLAGFEESHDDEFDAPHTAFSAPAYPDDEPEPPPRTPLPLPLPPAMPAARRFDDSDVRPAPLAFDESDLSSHAAPRYLRSPTGAPARSSPATGAQRSVPAAQPSAPARPAPESLDLESALEALDVDFDELAVPRTTLAASGAHAKRGRPATEPGLHDRQRQRTPSHPNPTRPAPSPAPLTTRPAPSPAPLSTRTPQPTPSTPLARAPSVAPGSKRPPRATSDDGILIDFDDDD